MIKANEMIEVVKQKEFIDIITDGPILRMYFMTDEIIRIRGSFDKKFEEASYILNLTTWEDDFDEFLNEYRTRIDPIEPMITEKEGSVLFETKALKVQIIKRPFGIKIYNRKKELLHSDLLGRGFVQDHMKRIFHYSAYNEKKDHYYGFGERAGKLDKKKMRMRLSPKDAIGHDPEFADPLYKHIPFYIRVDDETTNALGYFYHNSYDTTFDMGNEISGYYEPYTYYSSEGGDIDWFVIGGDTIKKVLNNYTLLTGRQILPPKKSLGFTISTMYYGELEEKCDEEIYKVIEKHQATGIHADNFKMSSGYTTGKGTQKRYVFSLEYR